MVLIFPNDENMSTDIHHEHPWRRIYSSIHQKMFYKFFETSPIHGASFIALRRTALEGYFWLVIMIIFCGLCIRDVVQLITTYLSIPTAISIEVMNNYTMKYDNVAICIDIFRYSILATVAAMFNESQFNATLTNILSLNSTPSKIDISTLNISDPDHDLVVKATYLMLVSFSDYEMQMFSQAYDPVSIRAVQLVQAFYTSNQFDIFALVQQTGKYMCLQTLDPNASPCVYYYYFQNMTDVCVDVCGNATVVDWLGFAPSNGMDDICFKLVQLPPGVTLFQGPSDWFIITQVHVSRPSISPTQWYNTQDEILFFLGYGAPEVWFDLRAGDGLVDAHYIDSAYWQADGTGAYVGLEVIATENAYNKTATPCFDFSEVSCAQQCVVEIFAAQKCWPVLGQALPDRPPGVTPCMLTYPNYNTSGSGRNYFENCIIGCGQKHCLSTCYQYRVGPYPMTIGTGSADSYYGTNISIYQARFVYPAFSEAPSMDFTNFLASFGGSLGLWLGGSVIAIAQIPIFALLTCYRTRVYNKGKLHPIPEKRQKMHDLREREAAVSGARFKLKWFRKTNEPQQNLNTIAETPNGIYDDPSFRVEYVGTVFTDSH